MAGPIPAPMRMPVIGIEMAVRVRMAGAVGVAVLMLVKTISSRRAKASAIRHRVLRLGM